MFVLRACACVFCCARCNKGEDDPFDDPLDGRAKLETLSHVVCKAEGANVAMAIKLL